MIFGGKKKDWEDEYDEYYTQRDPEYGRRVKPLLWIHLALLTTFAGVFLVIVGATSGGTMVEKSLKAVCTPVGLVWILLALIGYFSLVYKAGKTGLAAILCWLLLTAGGNWFVASFMASSLESSYQDVDPFDQAPYDVLLVLGGGTNMTPYGTPQLNAYGDRIMTAARIYHRGGAKKVMASGRQRYKSDPKDLHPNEETLQILQDLKIPGKDLNMLGGNNTTEEIGELKKWLDTLPENEKPRIGLLSSAWHLRRATAIAEVQGIDVHPVPSNFLSQIYAPNPGIIIPNAGNLQTTAITLHEHLGRLIGR